ncbi:hypothetical protein GGQ08_003296 [Salinibacter ruber]|uniref:hypothetical protein n=1 Tax=Salinibacter ruber TaxID=146919 RepID=UPI002167EACA|nr:hypothetical protein [Salinibacter ruber]MCS3655205.1 hypothetical protein [Salinibacter ruber]
MSDDEPKKSTDSTVDGQPETEGSGVCFMIAPIGSDGSSTRDRTENLLNHVIQPIVGEQLGFDVTVAHKIDRPGNITRQIMELLFEARLVIADLTEHNANVMYELAVRHATGEPVVTIAQEETTPPFDIGPQRTKFYKNTLGGVQDFKPTLLSAVKAALGNDHEPDNPIYHTRRDFQIRETAIEEGATEYILDRLDDIESEIVELRSTDTGNTRSTSQIPTDSGPSLLGSSIGSPRSITDVLKFQISGSPSEIDQFESLIPECLPQSPSLVMKVGAREWDLTRQGDGEATLEIHYNGFQEEELTSSVKEAADESGIRIEDKKTLISLSGINQ